MSITRSALQWCHNERDGFTIIVYSTVYSGTDHRKHQSSTSLAFVRGIHRWPVNSPHKWPVTRKMFPFDDVIMDIALVMTHGISHSSCTNVFLWCVLVWCDTDRFTNALQGWILPPAHYGHLFADDIFKSIFVNETFCIVIRIAVKFILKSLIDNKSALV